MLTEGAPRELMQSPFCGATAATRCCVESACLHDVLVWRLQPLTFHEHERVGLALTVCSEDRRMTAIPTANPATNGPRL